MGNRKQPFGYRMTLGEITIQPEEAETVRSIYLQYIAGASFKQLAEQLRAEDVLYDEDKSWNKNMVARILEDDRYIGKKEFPALITAEQFDAAQKRRKEMRPAYKQTPAQKTLRRLTALRVGGEDRHQSAQRAHTLPRPCPASGIPSGRSRWKYTGGAELRTGAAVHR